MGKARDTMPFEKMVEIGRVALVSFGADAGKLVVIVDVIDQNRALVDGVDGFARQALNFKQMMLTSIKINITRGIRAGKLAAAVKKEDMAGQFAKTAWAKKYAKQARRAELNDFDRFKTMLARKTRSATVRAEYA